MERTTVWLKGNPREISFKSTFFSHKYVSSLLNKQDIVQSTKKIHSLCSAYWFKRFNSDHTISSNNLQKKSDINYNRSGNWEQIMKKQVR